MMKNNFKLILLFGIITPLLSSCNSIKVNSVKIEGSNRIEIGETTSYKNEVLPKEATNKDLNWTCSDPSVAYVDDKGNVTGIKEGKVTITATAKDRSNSKDSKTLLIGDYIEKHVSSISFNQEKHEIEEGDYLYLNTVVSPSDADNKNIKYISNKTELATINEYGVIKGEKASGETVTITAIAEDGNIKEDFKLLVKERTTPRIIKGFSEPNLKIAYDNQLSNMEDVIDEKKINRDNSKNYLKSNFFKDNNSIYKVGCINPFKYKSTISWGKDEWQDLSDNNPYQTYTLEVKNGAGWSDGSTYLDSANYKNNEFKFNNSAVDHIFKLTIQPDSQKYNGVTSSMKSTLEFKVINAYNVYNFADFTTLDNWSTKHAKSILGENHKVFTKNEFVDNWKEFKEKNNVPIDANINGLVLHDNITIDPNSLSKYVKMSKQETYDLINGAKTPITKERFDNFVEIKSNMHQTDWKDYPDEVKRAKCFYMINGSNKDVSLFMRYQTDADFLFEGNYFTVDSSKVKPIVLFNRQTLDDYQSAASNKCGLIIFGGTSSHVRADTHEKIVQGEERYSEFRPYYKVNQLNEYKYTINNTHFIGNGVKNDFDDIGNGGFNCILQKGFTTINNCIINEFSCAVCANYPDLENSSSTINKCRFFNMFAHLIRCDGCRILTINDSFMAEAGGQGIIMWEDVPDYSKLEFLHTSNNIVLNNSYIECFVSGKEIYNQRGFSLYLIDILISVGLYTFEKYKNLDFGNNKCDHRNFLKIEDNIPKVNIVGMVNFSPFLSSYEPGLSTIKANNKMIMDLPEESKEGSIIDIYNQMDVTSRLAASITLKSSQDGHAKIPLYKIAEANDLLIYDKNINPKSEYTSDSTMLLSEYASNPKEYDSKYPTLSKNLANIFSGDYCSFYVKPLINYMFSIVVGYK